MLTNIPELCLLIIITHIHTPSLVMREIENQNQSVKIIKLLHLFIYLFIFKLIFLELRQQFINSLMQIFGYIIKQNTLKWLDRYPLFDFLAEQV